MTALAAVIIDLETDHIGGPTGDSPEAHYAENQIVLAGYTFLHNSGVCGIPRVIKPPASFAHLRNTLDSALETGLPIVGHNLKFDLKYLMREWPDLPWEKGKYVCTQYNTYRHSGQEHTMYSLEEACEIYGVPSPKKTFDLGEYIKGGGSIRDLDPTVLKTYLKRDLSLTAELFYRQPKAVWCNHLPALCEMELEGLTVDRERIKTRLKATTRLKDDAERTIEAIVGRFYTGVPPSSLPLKCTNRVLSQVLTGYPETIKLSKTLHLTATYPMLDSATIEAIWGTGEPSNETLGFSLDQYHVDKALQEVVAVTAPPETIKLLKNLQQSKLYNKLINTYYQPFLAKTTDEHPVIHPKLNTCVTKTSRLSSSDPNGQNLGDEIRACIKATNTETHYLLELDFKQLEIFSAALVTGDGTLLQDLQDGEDIHYTIGAPVFKWKDPSEANEKDRRTIKGVVFGSLYGGSAAGLAKQTGVDKSLIEDIIKAFYARYPKIKEWQRNYFLEVMSKLELHKTGKPTSEPRYKALVESTPFTPELKFLFKEEESPEWLKRKTGRNYSISPTKTKNYPLQGIAGGVLVPDFLQLFYKEVKSDEELRDNVKFKITVHDSVLLEVKKGSYIFKRLCEAADTASRTVSKRFFGEGALTLELTAKAGPTWGECK